MKSNTTQIKNRGSPNSSVLNKMLFFMKIMNEKNFNEEHSNWDFIVQIFIECITNIMFQYIVNYLNDMISNLF